MAGTRWINRTTALIGATGLVIAVATFSYASSRVHGHDEEHLRTALDNGIEALDSTLEPTSAVFSGLTPLLASSEIDEVAFVEIAGPAVRQNAFITNVAIFSGTELQIAVDEARLRTPPATAGTPVRLSGPPFFGDFITYPEEDSIVIIFDVRASFSELSMRTELVLPRTYLQLMAQAATEDTALVFWLETDSGMYPMLSTVNPIPDGVESITEEASWGASTIVVEARSLRVSTSVTERLMPFAIAALALVMTALAIVIVVEAQRRRVRMLELEHETKRLDREIKERLEVERLLAHQASHDSLTGLPNRAALIDALSARLRPDPNDRVGAILFLDVDNFKEVNDSIGHSAGDSLLQVIAKRLQSISSESSMLTRFGGDEFVIVTGPNVDPEDYCSRIHAVLRPPIDLSGQLVHGTTSIGVRIVDHDEQVGALEVIRDADAAMYEAKRAGRDRHFVFNVDVHRRAVDRMSIRGEADRAIRNNEFLVHYQPVIDLVTDSVVAVETLVRWDNPDRGLMLPDRFIPVLEDTDLITELDIHVRNIAGDDLVTWRSTGAFAGPLLMNASASSLLHAGFARSFEDLLARTGLPAAALGVEVTEQTLIADIDTAILVLSELRDMGIVVAIDDFGTGYSSLSYLHRLPFDVLKIDASFIENLTSDAASQSIVTTLTDLASRLDVRVVAEGIADAETQEMVKSLGCTLGQGRFLSPVLGADEFTSWLATSESSPVDVGLAFG